MNGLWAFMAAIISFVVSAVMGRWLIPFLHKIKYGQTILDIGPSWHKNKQGTPTMGGIMFIISSILAIIICVPLYYSTSKYSDVQFVEPVLISIKIFAGVVMALGYGIVGFMDDYIKVVKKRNLGLTAKQKLVLQFLIAILYLSTIYLAGANSKTLIPFYGYLDLGFLYWPLSAVIIVGMVNAVNLTDGIDGLNGSVTFFVMVFFMIISSYLSLNGFGIAAAAMAGGCLGYLIWNFYPAKVFMGDTGSLFLGGFLCSMAFGINMPILLLPLGIVYIIEILSVVLQVTYFKLTKGKRLFKMSPIHHHFEMCKWNEIKICVVFCSVAVCGGIIALALVVLGV